MYEPSESVILLLIVAKPASVESIAAWGLQKNTVRTDYGVSFKATRLWCAKLKHNPCIEYFNTYLISLSRKVFTTPFSMY